ncbi:MAG: hypothetical protein AB7G06_04245 [Bdellovibrionales bacterium]
MAKAASPQQRNFDDNIQHIGAPWRIQATGKRDTAWQKPVQSRTTGYKVFATALNGKPLELYHKSRDCRVEAFLITLCGRAGVPVQRMYLRHDAASKHGNLFAGLSEMAPASYRSGSQGLKTLQRLNPEKLGRVMAAILYLERDDDTGANVLFQDIDDGDISLIDLKECYFGQRWYEKQDLAGSVPYDIRFKICAHRKYLKKEDPARLKAYDDGFKDTWERLRAMKGPMLEELAAEMLPTTWRRLTPLRSAIKKLNNRSNRTLASLGIF